MKYVCCIVASHGFCFSFHGDMVGGLKCSGPTGMLADGFVVFFVAFLCRRRRSSAFHRVFRIINATIAGPKHERTF